MGIERQSNPFDTPVAGQSLTDTPKNWAWENPPRFVDAEKASQFIWNKLHNKETASKVIILLEAGVSVQAITKVLVFSGFIEGAFTPDLGLLVTPIVEKMILTMGKAAKVEKIKLSRPKEKETKKVLEAIFKSRNANEDIEALKNKDKKEKVNEEKNINKGLMSKGDE